jgi:hypothetical protein
MERESVIDKVRKLRNLSTSSNLNEAATAARLAEKLIQEHCLAEAELEITEGSNEVTIEDGIAVTDWNQRQTRWQNVMLTYLTQAYACEGVLRYNADRKLGFYCIGRPSDIATVRYQYAYFAVELVRLANLLAPRDLNRGEGKHWHNSFYLGAVQAIGESLAAAKKEVRAQASSSALAIVDKHADDAAALMKHKYPSSRSVSFKSNIDADAWRTGHQAGSTLQSKPGLGSGVRGLLK